MIGGFVLWQGHVLLLLEFSQDFPGVGPELDCALHVLRVVGHHHGQVIGSVVLLNEPAGVVHMRGTYVATRAFMGMRFLKVTVHVASLDAGHNVAHCFVEAHILQVSQHAVVYR